MTIDLATVVRATGARVLHAAPDGAVRENELRLTHLERELTDVAVDSRAVTPGGLFVALRGDRVDGHDYVGAAFAAGAYGCLIAESSNLSRVAEELRAGAVAAGGTRFAFVVPDPLRGLHDLAACWRRRHAVEVIGITGSVGKTTTKEITASLLSFRHPVLRSEANLNTEIGLPLMLLRLAAEHRVAVLEMGMYAPGDIALLADLARPRIGIVTNVAPIHLERMGTLERIARAKSELVAALPADGLAILNGDNPWTRAMALSSGIAAVALFGYAADCAYRAEEVVSHGLAGTSFLLVAEDQRFPLRISIPGRHVIPAVLAAIAAARSVGMDWPEIMEAVELVRADARQQIIRTRDDLLIIDDSYNAAPLSVNAALDLLDASPGAKIAVLGDMLELGPQEEEAHRQVGARAAEIADWLVVRGPRSAWIADSAEARGLAAEHVIRAASNADAIQAVLDIVAASPGTNPVANGPRMQRPEPASGEADVRWAVLVKGSRGMGLEEVVQGLRGTS